MSLRNDCRTVNCDRMSENSEAPTAVIAERRSERSDAERATTRLARGYPQMADAMSEMSDAVTVAVGPSAMADRMSERVEASSATPPPELMPAMTAEAMSDRLEASKVTVTAAMADLRSLMSDALIETPAPTTTNKLLKLLVKALSRSL